KQLVEALYKFTGPSVPVEKRGNDEGCLQWLWDRALKLGRKSDIGHKCVLVQRNTGRDAAGQLVTHLVFQASQECADEINASMCRLVLIDDRMYRSSLCRPDGTFDLMMKPGDFRNECLEMLRFGDYVFVRPFSTTKTHMNPGYHVGLVARGLGLPDLFWVAAQELEDPSVQDVVLLYIASLEEQSILGQELEVLQQLEPRFHASVLVSDSSCGVDLDVLAKAYPLAGPAESVTARFAFAGRSPFIQQAFHVLASLGYPMASSKLFGPACTMSTVLRGLGRFFGKSSSPAKLTALKIRCSADMWNARVLHRHEQEAG
ncbi:cbr1, partial [Symbiodinium sp. CCMP2592]